MSRVRLFCVLLATAFLGAAPVVLTSQDKVPDVKGDGAPKFMTGARPTPHASILAALKAGKVGVYKAATAPAQVVVVPERLSYWGNNQYGICVTSESCFAIAAYSTYITNKEIFVTEKECIAWARARGYLNGANLLEVIQDMQADGIKDENGTLRKAGKSSVVDYRSEAALQSGIAKGTLSIAIASNALPSSAGSRSGWYVEGSRSYPSTDHCVSLPGYGPAKVMFKSLGVALPAGIDPEKTFYALFTWNTIGLVDHKWILNTCVEAWLRDPTIVGLDPAPPQPQPGKITVAVSGVIGGVGTPVKFSPLASGGTVPYLFMFDYGDGTQDLSGSHAYAMAGSYKVAVTAVDSTGATGVGTCTATIGTTPPGPGPTPVPGGLTFILPQNTPAGTYTLALPGELEGINADLEAIQRRLNGIRGVKSASKK